MTIQLAPLVAAYHPLPATPSEDGYRQLVRRVRSEYLEMPGLCLTFAQACRLWALDSLTCRRVLQDLVAEGFVGVSDHGVYARQTTA